jgi:hypothetical protein
MTLLQKTQKAILSRRAMLRSAAAAAMFGPLFKATEGSVSAQETVNRNSAPSGLKITDMRACRLATNYDYPLIKIYTNQDVYGLGEVRDAGVEGIALSPQGAPAGEESSEHRGQPQDAARVRRPRAHGRRLQRGGHGPARYRRQGLRRPGLPADLGQKRHDRIRIYADTTAHPDLKVYAERMRKRKEMGLTFFKMDLETDLVKDRPNAVNDRAASPPTKASSTSANSSPPSAT